MKRRLIISFVIGITVFALFKIHQISTEGIQLSAENFLKKAEKIGYPASMSSLSYGGIKKNRAYLRSWEMNRFPKIIDYWTPLEEFGEATRHELEEGLGQWSQTQKR